MKIKIRHAARRSLCPPALLLPPPTTSRAWCKKASSRRKPITIWTPPCAYQAAIDGFDTDRQLSATAVFRLGECLRKAGKTNEADIQYERILRDFADQTNLAGLCREFLGGVKPAPHAGSASAATATPPKTKKSARSAK